MRYFVNYPRTAAALIFFVGMIRAVWQLFNPDTNDQLAVLEARNQPFAVLMGSLVPWIIAAVAAYFILQAISKREVLAQATPSALPAAPPQKPAVSGLDQALDAVEAMGALMETYPSAILDEAALPAPKPQMKAMLRTAMGAFRNDASRTEILRTAWLFLGSFQPGIGPTPLVPPALSTTRMPSAAEMSAFRPYVLWTRLNRALELGVAGSSWTDAAHATNFADSAHLTRTCRRMYGLFPTSMRIEQDASRTRKAS